MSDLPRLLLCCFDVVPAPTAISRRLTEYVKGLSERYQVVVLSVKTPDHTHIERYHGARLLRVPVGGGDLAARVQAFDRAVRRQLESEEYVLVHFFDPFGGYALCERRGELGYKLIYDACTLPSVELPFLYAEAEASRRFLARVRRQELFCLMNADQVIVGAELTREHVIGLGVPREQVQVLAAPVDLGPYAPEIVGAPDAVPMTVLHLGTQSAAADLDTALAAMQLALRTTELRLTLVGPRNAEHAPRLERRIAELGLTGRVELQPPVAHDDLHKVLAAADVGFLGLSEVERNTHIGTPLSRLGEYLAAGRPVIAADVPSARTQVPPDAAVLYRPGDARSLADALVSLATDVGRRLALGAAARAAASTRDSARLRADLVALYVQVSGTGARAVGDAEATDPDEVTQLGQQVDDRADTERRRLAARQEDSSTGPAKARTDPAIAAPEGGTDLLGPGTRPPVMGVLLREEPAVVVGEELTAPPLPPVPPLPLLAAPSPPVAPVPLLLAPVTTAPPPADHLEASLTRLTGQAAARREGAAPPAPPAAPFEAPGVPSSTPHAAGPAMGAPAQPVGPGLSLASPGQATVAVPPLRAGGSAALTDLSGAAPPAAARARPPGPPSPALGPAEPPPRASRPLAPMPPEPAPERAPVLDQVDRGAAAAGGSVPPRSMAERAEPGPLASRTEASAPPGPAAESAPTHTRGVPPLPPLPPGAPEPSRAPASRSGAWGAEDHSVSPTATSRQATAPATTGLPREPGAQSTVHVAGPAPDASASSIQSGAPAPALPPRPSPPVDRPSAGAPTPTGDLLAPLEIAPLVSPPSAAPGTSSTSPALRALPPLPRPPTAAMDVAPAGPPREKTPPSPPPLPPLASRGELTPGAPPLPAPRPSPTSSPPNASGLFPVAPSLPAEPAPLDEAEAVAEDEIVSVDAEEEAPEVAPDELVEVPSDEVATVAGVEEEPVEELAGEASFMTVDTDPAPPASAIDPWLAQLVHGYCPPESNLFNRHTPPTTMPGRDT